MNEDCENIFTKTGWGICQYFLIGICALCTAAEAGAVVIIPLVTPLLFCDLNFNEKDIVALNAVLSLGMAIGSLIFGLIADYNGRKNLISVTLIIIFCSSIGLSFSQIYFLISLSIFVLGVGIAGNNITLRVYLIECLPARKRGSSLAVIDLFWSIGITMAIGLSWTLTPSVIRMLNNDFRPSSWRVLTGLASTPSLLMACATSLLPSSPRYLLYSKRQNDALVVLQQMFAVNNSVHAHDFPPCNLENCVKPDDDVELDDDDNFILLKTFFIKSWRRIMLICSPKFIKNTLLLFFVRFLLFPGFTLLIFWKSYFSTIEYESNVTCINDYRSLIMSFLHNCQLINQIHFKYSLIFSTSFILGEILLASVIDIVGRKLIVLISGVIGGTSIIALIFLTSHLEARIILSFIFLISHSIIYTSTSVLLLENYPTSVRATIFGLTSVLPHIATFFIKFLPPISCFNILDVLSALLIGAAISTLPINDLIKLPIQEAI